MKRYVCVMFTIFAASLLILAGCSGGDDDAKGKESTSKTKEPADERTLTIAITTDVVTFDIHDHNNTSTEAVHINMFNYLVRKDADGEFQSDLAESYENIDDHTWEFTLHEGVTFHNGDELTAKDVKYTLERVANDEGLREYSQYRQIKEVEVIDDYNFRIITHEPEPVLLNRLSRLGSGILPSDYIEENGWDHFLTNPVGTGPFKFTEWKRDSELVFDVYEDYFQGQVEQWDKLIFR
ncbi:MAG TPA: ABC transporter substrate-binding protein, partial [Pseudogracilibacillus sp.]|nr:ABC transporter substrate-binding protein [Pseudogracilibacillus sp.]